MVVVDSIKKGTVIDHIAAGRGMRLLEYLAIDPSRETVALIANASSHKMGRKDIIKIEDRIDIDLTVVGLVDPGATVDIIEDHIVQKKLKPELPKRVENVIKCRNPRCVTSVETTIPHIFMLTNTENQEYRCIYCDEIVSMKEKY